MKIFRGTKETKKFRKMIWFGILIEYVVMSMILVVLQIVLLIKTNNQLQAVVLSQQETIALLSKTTQTGVVNQIVANALEYVNAEESATSYKYNLTLEERELLAKLLYCEGRGESLDCQKAIVSVVINRINKGYWGNSLESVVYAKNQFEPVEKGLLKTANPTAKQYEAVDYVLKNGVTVPEDVIYFRAGHYFSWATNYMAMDNTYFSY